MIYLYITTVSPFLQNEKAGVDPDHWYEINLANCVLFPDLVLEGVDQLLPGRLFTTRMPRNISSSPDSALKFQEKKETFNLHTALILTGMRIAYFARYLLTALSRRFREK